MKTFTLFLICVFVLVGCKNYQPPQQYEFEKERIIEKSYDEVWQSVIDFFGTTGTLIKNMDKSSGFIATEPDLGASFSNFMDCGTPGYGFGTKQVFENPMGNFNVVVQRVTEKSTRVKVNSFFKCDVVVYQMQNGNYYPVRRDRVECNSTGYLERLLLNYLSR